MPEGNMAKRGGRYVSIDLVHSFKALSYGSHDGVSLAAKRMVTTREQRKY